jgi:D-sedoheptulose 7-phosphate isomerase
MARSTGSLLPSQIVRAALTDHLEVVGHLVEQADVIADIADRLIQALRAGRKALVFGNGGSAADAQHMAAELVGRYLATRAALPAIALTGNSSNLTAIGNDYGFVEIFARQVEALGQAGDVAVGITTSGRSENVLRALKTARSARLTTVALTGRAGLALGEVDLQLRIASDNTPRIQEAHIAAIHCVCDLVERAWLPASTTGLR